MADSAPLPTNTTPTATAAAAAKRQSLAATTTSSPSSSIPNNTGNRLSMNAASPSHGSQSQGGPGEFDALSKAIGARIKLTTSGPSPLTIEGTLFTACPVTNLIAISVTAPTSSSASDQPPFKPQPSTFHVLPVSRIQTFNLISLSPTAAGFESAQPSIARLDLKALKAREDDAIQKIKARDAARGKGVTKEAQDIFDALARTLPTRWHETSIIVNDTVMIRAPYRVEDCHADKQNQNALVRVKKVLESEKKKIADRNASASASASPAAATPVTRKGG